MCQDWNCATAESPPSHCRCHYCHKAGHGSRASDRKRKRGRGRRFVSTVEIGTVTSSIAEEAIKQVPKESRLFEEKSEGGIKAFVGSVAKSAFITVLPAAISIVVPPLSPVVTLAIAGYRAINTVQELKITYDELKGGERDINTAAQRLIGAGANVATSPYVGKLETVASLEIEQTGIAKTISAITKISVMLITPVLDAGTTSLISNGTSALMNHGIKVVLGAAA